MMIIICLFLTAFSALYTPYRLKKLWGFKRAWPLQAAVLLLLVGFYVMLATGAYTSTSPVAAVAYSALGLFFIFQIYLFMFLFAAHILTFIFKKVRSKRIAGPCKSSWKRRSAFVDGSRKRGQAASIILACLGLVGLGFYQAQSFTVTNHEIQVKGLTKAVSIVHVTDLHLGAQRGETYLQKVIEAIRRHKPDLVLYNGDMIDSNIALRPELFALFKNIDAEQYFTTGNHEFYIDTDKAMALIENAGIRVLRSKMVETHGLQLIGMEYMNADKATYDSHMVNDLTLEEELPKIQRSAALPTILAHHSPVGLRYVARGNIDVMLSGHTHGGQLFPGNILVGLRFPMNKGLYQANGTALLVSQGAGTFGPWMRLGTFNEIQFVTLVPQTR